MSDVNNTINVEPPKAEPMGDNADDEDAPPPEPNVDKYEETNAKYQCRCKLYERIMSKDGGPAPTNYQGCGELFVKAMDDPNKLHVIIRQDPDLRRVLLNQVITQNIPVKLFPKTLRILAPSSDGTTRFYVVKVKDDKIAGELFTILNSAKSSTNN